MKEEVVPVALLSPIFPPGTSCALEHVDSFQGEIASPLLELLC